MTDILPIDREKLVDEPKELKMEIEPITEEGEGGEDDGDSSCTEVDEEEIFEKPKKKNVFKKELVEDEDPKPKKKKRVLSEKQLENLKKAREKSMARRKELKEARDMDAALKKDARLKKKEDRIRKKEEGDELILMKAKLKREAEAEGHWDEERITKLMERTLDSYMEKRKKERSIPKTTIPAPQAYPQAPANQQPMDPRYYSMPQQTSNYHQHRHTKPTKQGSHASNDTLSNLFGFNQQNPY